MTRTIATLFATTAAILGILHSAFAADMTGTEIKAFLSGNTTYLDGGDAIYWAPAGTVLFKDPSGKVSTGTWVIKGDQLCLNQQVAPERPCSKYVKDGDTVTVHAADTGELRARVIKTAPGNAENIAP